ncbi:MAG TPA: hypothetical protein VJV03_16210 [Pyrinomonadaceae bacterium]|nr:hypothetical protein [Pyrinomonadaceae bacterium]
MKIKDLLAEKRVLESEIAKRQAELQAVEVLISRAREREGLPPVADSLSASSPDTNGTGKQPRVRGTLKAAKQAVDHFPGPFTRSQLLSKIEELNPSLRGRIRPEALRMSMRELIKIGWMAPVENEVSEETGEALYRNYALKS